MGNGFNFSDIDEPADNQGVDGSVDHRSYANRAAQSVVEEAFDQTPNTRGRSSGGESIREQAVRQMEQANLYKVLLDNSIFAQGSAREDIQELVEAEIKAFIEDRLAELLGLKTSPKAQATEVFSEVEITALKALALKVASKMPDSVKKPSEPPTPALNTIVASTAPSPALNPVAAPRKPVLNTPTAAPKPAPAKKAPKPAPIKSLNEMTPEEAREEIRRRKEASGETPQPRARKKLPMPSLEEQMQKYATEIAQNSEATSVAELLNKAR